MASDTDDLKKRLADLESKFSFQSDTLEALNETVTLQWKDIDLLKRKLEALDGQVYEMETNAGNQSPNQKPPHY